MQLTGILRDPTYSPDHHADNDRLILELTAHALRRRGCRVQVIEEKEVGTHRFTSPAIFSMCQGPQANVALAQLEQQGHLIINSPAAVRRCYRTSLLDLLGPHSADLAPMRLVSTAGGDRLDRLLAGGSACWIKRADVHATQHGDVVKVSSVAEGRNALARFSARGLTQVVVQRHVEGTVVKFYGVTGTSFFRFYCERDRKVAPVAFWSARASVERLVQQVGLLVYGGDAVLTDQGQVVVIDINDWPSFACFREEAAEAIAHQIYSCTIRHIDGRQPRRAATALAGLPAHHSRR